MSLDLPPPQQPDAPGKEQGSSHSEEKEIMRRELEMTKVRNDKKQKQGSSNNN
jgi:hypothetical protein